MTAAVTLPPQVGSPGHLVEAHDVVLSFGQTPALRGASLSVASGEVVLAALAASLAVIASTLPLLTRLTGPETARNE